MGRTRRKKKHTQDPSQVEAAKRAGEKVPKSFVIARGKLSPLLRQLQQDLRRLMMPHTALHLKEKKSNTLKDFVHVAGPLGVTHLLMLSNTKTAPYLRVARCPHGPTLTFKIHSYSLAADIARAQLHPRAPAGIFKCSPLIVLAGFGSEEEHLKLITIMFQNIFPAIDVNTVKLATCQRVVLLSYSRETKHIEFRHYAISLQPEGVSRRLRKLVQHRKIPDLRGLTDVSEFVTKAGYGSESEAEDETATVHLATDYGRINRASQQSAVKLHEVGPRLTLQLVKVEEGLCDGGVMFHEYVKKTPEEVAALRDSREEREALRKQRKAEQEANVRRKELSKTSRKYTKANEEVEPEDDMDDAEWYRQEVGQEPDTEFLTGSLKRSSAKFKKRTSHVGNAVLEPKGQPVGEAANFKTRKRKRHEEKINVSGSRNGQKSHKQKPGKSDFQGRKKFGLGIADKILSQRKGARFSGSEMHHKKRRKTKG